MSRKQREPWERMPKESDPAWEAFVIYRDWPTEHGTKRTTAAVQRTLSKSLRLIQEWSRKWSWVDRCAAYDEYMDEIAIEERVRVKREQAQAETEMDARHVSMAIQLQKLMLDFVKGVEVDEIGPKQLSDLTKAFKDAIAIERTSRHADNVDRRLELQREMFEYQKEQDAGENIEYEYLDDVEADVYGNGDGDSEGESPAAKDGET